MSLLQTLLLLVFPALVIVAGLRDVVSFIIPNWISLVLLAVFPLAALACGLPLGAIGLNAAIGAAVLVVGMGMFALGWMGGGDIKLMAASALWLGWPAILTMLLVTAIVGGALSVGLLFVRSAAVRPFLLQGPRWFARLTTEGENVPYGVAIAVGALAAFSGSPLVTMALRP